MIKLNDIQHVFKLLIIISNIHVLYYSHKSEIFNNDLYYNILKLINYITLIMTNKIRKLVGNIFHLDSHQESF